MLIERAAVYAHLALLKLKQWTGNSRTWSHACPRKVSCKASVSVQQCLQQELLLKLRHDMLREYKQKLIAAPSAAGCHMGCYLSQFSQG